MLRCEQHRPKSVPEHHRVGQLHAVDPLHPGRDQLVRVAQDVLAEVLQLAKAYRLVLAVDRLGTSFIWPLALPDPERPNAWHLSAMEADNAAQQHWVRIQSNQALGAYEVYEAQGELTDPVWPEESWQKLVHVAFKGKIIDTHDHIVLQKLRGEL